MGTRSRLSGLCCQYGDSTVPNIASVRPIPEP
jgi:hypothetical protein